MREHGMPRFENDDYSPYAGRDYREKHSELKNFMGKGPRGYTRKDDRIYEEVCEALQDDPSLDTSIIAVKVENGIVTLEGKVQGRMEKRMAEMITIDVPGVLDVRNEIVLS